MITVTLDSCVVFGGVDGPPDRRQALQTILSLVDRGIVHAAVTSRVHQDKLADMDLDRVKRDYGVFLNVFPVIGAPFRPDVSIVGGPDVVADLALHEALVNLFPSKKLNTAWDIDHLYGHRAAGRNYFLTTDKAILKKAGSLEHLGIRVMDPRRFAAVAEEAVAEATAAGADLETAVCSRLEKLFMRIP